LAISSLSIKFSCRCRSLDHFILLGPNSQLRGRRMRVWRREASWRLSILVVACGQVVIRREMSRHPRASERTHRVLLRRTGRVRFPFSMFALGIINKLITATLIGRRNTDEVKRSMHFQGSFMRLTKQDKCWFFGK